MKKLNNFYKAINIFVLLVIYYFFLFLQAAINSFSTFQLIYFFCKYHFLSLQKKILNGILGPSAYFRVQILICLICPLSSFRFNAITYLQFLYLHVMRSFLPPRPRPRSGSIGGYYIILFSFSNS